MFSPSRSLSISNASTAPHDIAALISRKHAVMSQIGVWSTVQRTACSYCTKLTVAMLTARPGRVYVSEV